MASTRSAKPRDDRALAPEPVASSTATPVPQPAAPARDAALVPGQAYGQFAVAPKLDVGSADDAAEVEADRIADQVVEHLHGTGCGHAGHERHEGHEGHAPDAVRRSPAAATAEPSAAIGLAGGAVSADNEQRITAARAGGRSLPALVRREMEGAFGADFSSVRVHSGSEASALNEGMSARAFTVGSDIFFKEGLPDTAKPAGAHLLAHELSHVVQQAPGAARAVVRRDHELLGKKISAPTNVKVRTGASDTPVALDSKEDAAKAFGVPMMGPRLTTAPSQENLLADTDDKAAAAPGAPAAAAPAPAATPAAPMPSRASIAIPGVDGDLEVQDPFKAVEAHRKYAGKLFTNSETKDTEVETFSRFVEKDYARIVALNHEYQGLAAGTKDPKSLAKKKKDLEDKAGAQKLPLPEGVDRSVIWTVVMSIGDERLALAKLARKNANEDVPLVDSVYEMAREEEKAVKLLTGGKSAKHTAERAMALQAKGDDAGVAKHQERQAQMADAAERARSLGNSVREAHLSDSRLTLKAKELATHKAAIGEAQTTGDWWKAKGTTVGKALIGVGVSTLTAGIVKAEDGESEGVLGKMGMKPRPIWERIDTQLDEIVATLPKKGYGDATAFHAGLHIFNFVLREIRDVIGGIGLLIGLLGAAVGLGAPPVGAAIAGVGVTLGLVALGLTLFKIVIEAVLASWGGLQRAISENARNHNLVAGQARKHAAEGLGDVMSAASKIGLPMATNAAISGHGLNAVDRPDLQVGDPSQIGKLAPASTAGLDWTVAQTAMQEGSGLAVDIAGPVLGDKVVEDENHQNRGKHKTAAPRALPARPTTREAASQEAVHQQARATPKAEPAWVKTGKANESETRTAGIDMLLLKHTRTMGQFHDKTQDLMKAQQKSKDEAASAKKKMNSEKAVKAKDEDSVLDTVQNLAGKTRTVVGALDDGTAPLTDPKKLYALVIAELKAKQGA